MSPAALVRRATAQGGKRALKYSAVSVIGVAVTQVLLLAFHGLLELTPAWSNVLAVSIASLPAYLLNRAWVWGKRGRSHFRREVLPFWGFALVGLAFSTLLVHLIVDVWDSTLAPNAANIVAFGSMWVVKYLVLDAVLFGEHTHEAPLVRAETSA